MVRRLAVSRVPEWRRPAQSSALAWLAIALATIKAASGEDSEAELLAQLDDQRAQSGGITLWLLSGILR